MEVDRSALVIGIKNLRELLPAIFNTNTAKRIATTNSLLFNIRVPQITFSAMHPTIMETIDITLISVFNNSILRISMILEIGFVRALFFLAFIHVERS
jgi:hypothetical protein